MEAQIADAAMITTDIDHTTGTTTMATGTTTMATSTGKEMKARTEAEPGQTSGMLAAY